MFRTRTGQPCSGGAPAEAAGLAQTEERSVAEHTWQTPRPWGIFYIVPEPIIKTLNLEEAWGWCVRWSPQQWCDTGICFHAVPTHGAAHWPCSTGTLSYTVRLISRHHCHSTFFFLKTCFRRAFHPEVISTEYIEMGAWAGEKVREERVPGSHLLPFLLPIIWKLNPCPPNKQIGGF